MSRFKGQIKKLKPSKQSSHPETKALFVIKCFTKEGKVVDVLCPDWKVDYWKAKLAADPDVTHYAIKNLLDSTP